MDHSGSKCLSTLSPATCLPLSVFAPNSFETFIKLVESAGHVDEVGTSNQCFRHEILMVFCWFISPITRIYGGLYIHACMGLPEKMPTKPTNLMINHHFSTQIWRYFGRKLSVFRHAHINLYHDEYHIQLNHIPIYMQ